MKITSHSAKSLTIIATLLASSLLFASTRPEWKATLKADTFSNYTDDANVLSAGLSAKSDLELTNTLSLMGEIDLRWRTGRAQSWYGYDANKDGFSFSNAYLQFRPLNFFSLQAGAISTKYLNTPTLVTATFPGIKENLIFSRGSFTANLSAFQAIPTSSSMNISRSEKEQLPLFAVENIKLSYARDKFKADLSVNHFLFKNLPSTVAYKSSFLGNNTVGFYESDSSFLFGFNGYSVTAIVNYRLNNSLKFNVAIERVENLEAAYGYGRSQVLKTSSEILIGDNILKPEVELFFTEADSAPAYYNSSRYGNTNRKGYSLGIGYKLPHKGFKVSAHFVDADLIDIGDLINSREQYLFLKLETLYKKF